MYKISGKWKAARSEGRVKLAAFHFPHSSKMDIGFLIYANFWGISALFGKKIVTFAGEKRCKMGEKMAFVHEKFNIEYQ